MSDQEYRVRIVDAENIILDAVFPSYAMAHRFLDNQTLHDDDWVDITAQPKESREMRQLKEINHA